MLAQNKDSIVQKMPVSHPTVKKDTVAKAHSPKKAALFSAILPGSGQVYNHQAWKVALFYGGLGALGYLIYDNNKIYKDYRQQWIYLTDLDANTNVRDELSGASPDALHNAFSSFRKYRDQSVIGFVLVYAANIIDANVYAHLYYFNVDDLTFHLTPNYNLYTKSMTPSLTLRYQF